MSWDMFVQDFPPQAKSVAEIPRDFKPAPIGSRSDIIGSIIAVIPTAKFSGPRWGLIVGQDWSIEVNLGANEECRSFALHLRGGDAAVGVVAAILQRLNLRAIDCQTSEFFDAGKEEFESFRRWRKYRDKVVNSYNK